MTETRGQRRSEAWGIAPICFTVGIDRLLVGPLLGLQMLLVRRALPLQPDGALLEALRRTELSAIGTTYAELPMGSCRPGRMTTHLQLLGADRVRISQRLVQGCSRGLPDVAQLGLSRLRPRHQSGLQHLPLGHLCLAGLRRPLHSRLQSLLLRGAAGPQRLKRGLLT